MAREIKVEGHFAIFGRKTTSLKEQICTSFPNPGVKFLICLGCQMPGFLVQGQLARKIKGRHCPFLGIASPISMTGKTFQLHPDLLARGRLADKLF